MGPIRWDGVLDDKRWRLLNKHLSKYLGVLSRDEIINEFCVDFRILRQRVEAALATYRHCGPDILQ